MISSSRTSFAVAMRDHQLEWALGGGVPRATLEERKGKTSWVLKPEHRERNLFKSSWWQHIAGKEHLWARALNSSQCFGLNLFGPLAEDNDRARRVLNAFLPEQGISQQDTVQVRFEHSPEGAAEWLGERGQGTQVDVFFEVRRVDRLVGFVLIEVKFTETSFGECRGWHGKTRTGWINRRRPRCEDALAVANAPQTQCWLSEDQGRHYWELLARPSAALRIDQIKLAGACPFRHGLYQLMRNRVLADELRRQIPGSWVEFAVCCHPGNRALAGLKEPVAGSSNAIEAFRKLSSVDAVREWSAREVIDVCAVGVGLSDWRAWMLSRYFPSDVPQSVGV
jgi:hypothetical protein